MMCAARPAKWSVEWHGARESERRRTRERGDTGMERTRVRKREQSFHGLLPLLIWQAPGSPDISAGLGRGGGTFWESGREKEEHDGAAQGQRDQPTVTVETNPNRDRRPEGGLDHRRWHRPSILVYSSGTEKKGGSTYPNFLRNEIEASPENWKTLPAVQTGSNEPGLLSLTWFINNNFNKGINGFRAKTLCCSLLHVRMRCFLLLWWVESLCWSDRRRKVVIKAICRGKMPQVLASKLRCHLEFWEDILFCFLMILWQKD